MFKSRFTNLPDNEGDNDMIQKQILQIPIHSLYQLETINNQGFSELTLICVLSSAWKVSIVNSDIVVSMEHKWVPFCYGDFGPIYTSH